MLGGNDFNVTKLCFNQTKLCFRETQLYIKATQFHISLLFCDAMILFGPRLTDCSSFQIALRYTTLGGTLQDDRSFGRRNLHVTRHNRFFTLHQIYTLQGTTVSSHCTKPTRDKAQPFLHIAPNLHVTRHNSFFTLHQTYTSQHKTVSSHCTKPTRHNTKEFLHIAPHISLHWLSSEADKWLGWTAIGF